VPFKISFRGVNVDIRGGKPDGLLTLISQVEREIAILEAQAQCARILAEKAESECEHRGHQGFASKCEAQSKELHAYLEKTRLHSAQKQAPAIVPC